MYRIILLIVITFLTNGCSGSLTSVLGIPVPGAEYSIQSVASYNKKNNIDLQNMQHDMNLEIAAEQKAAADFPVKISINNQQIRPQAEIAFMQKSKRIGGNDYKLVIPKVPLIEKQKGDTFCWAACVKYLIDSRFDIVVDQNKIVDVYKNDKNGIDNAGSVIDMISALGYLGLKLSNNGSRHLLVTLGNERPVMMGLRNNNSQFGHAIIVVGVRYSFVNSMIPKATPELWKAFSEFYVYDPAHAGILEVVKAEDIVNNIDFILSYRD